MQEIPSQEDQHATNARPGVRVLLLDDDPANLFLRANILRLHGYDCLPVGSIADAIQSFPSIDIAVLDYHLGAGQFGSDVAVCLRQVRPEVPIVILSATLEHRFGGTEDMHLLKGFSSNEDLLNALRALEAKRRGAPVVVDARDFFYSRIGLAIGTDVLVQIFDPHGNWIYLNETAAEHLGHPRDGLLGKNLFAEKPDVRPHWREILSTVSSTRETYIDRTHRGLFTPNAPPEPAQTWSVLAFPITLHDGANGVVLTARLLT